MLITLKNLGEFYQHLNQQQIGILAQINRELKRGKKFLQLLGITEVIYLGVCQFS